MIGNIENEPTLHNLCAEVYKRLENKSSRKDCLREVLNSRVEGKMSESEYIHYQFLKVLNEMYREGFNAGRSSDGVDSDSQPVSGPMEATSLKSKTASDDYAIQLAPLIRKIRSKGARTLQQIADELTKIKIKTATGNDRWHPSTVRRLEENIIRCTVADKIHLSD